MRELYLFVSDPGHCRTLGLIFMCVTSIGIMSFIWSNAKWANVRLSTFEWGQIYLLGLIAFLSGILTFGYMIVPKNADSLLEMIKLKSFMESYTEQVRKFLMYIVRMFL